MKAITSLRTTLISTATLVLLVVFFVNGCMKQLQKNTPLPGRGSSLPGVIGVQGGTPSEYEDQLAQSTPGSQPSLDEEIWVIIPDSTIRPEPADDVPGTGTLMTRWQEKEVAIPLRHTDVQADLHGYISSVRVRQQFHNPYDGKIEAVYVFPLPQNAAVHEFIMTIGNRKIRGLIREREEAEAVYEEAKRQGYTASLMTQERPNIFTQSVANIEPGKQIDVDIRYFHTLRYDAGFYEFVFPMVVGPRFNPPGSDRGVGAVARENGGQSGQPTEVTYLHPTEKTQNRISLVLNVHAGVDIDQIQSLNHSIDTEKLNPNHTRVILREKNSPLNRDFVLRYKVAHDVIQSSLITHQDSTGGYFTLMLYPPSHLNQLQRQPVEMVFVLDCSGSMSGQPLFQAKAAVKQALHRLQPDDSFQIIRFSNKSSSLGRHPLEATPRNIRRGLRYLNSLNSGGGTMMIEGIKAALDFPHDPDRLRFVTFLTDGYK